ncbi:MAG: hypothetical protein ACREWG_05840 [Gammaproteobacteria bacterium]
MVEAMIAFFFRAVATALRKAIRQDESAFHKAKSMAIGSVHVEWAAERA